MKYKFLKMLIHTIHYANARFVCGVDLPIDEDAVGDDVVFDLASFRSNTVER